MFALMSTDMIVDGGGLSTIQGLRRLSGGLLLTPSTSTHDVGHATHASAIATPVSSAKVQATGLENSPGDRTLVRGFSSAAVRSLG